MLGVGLVGTWSAVWESVSLSKLTSDVPNSIATYAIAVVAAAFAEVVLDNRERDSDEGDANTFSDTTFRMFALSVVIIAVAFGLLALKLGDTHWTGTFFAVCAAAISLFLWWIVNADNPNLRVPTNLAKGPIGGQIDLSEDLPGSLDNIKS